MCECDAVILKVSSHFTRCNKEPANLVTLYSLVNEHPLLVPNFEILNNLVCTHTPGVVSKMMSVVVVASHNGAHIKQECINRCIQSR